MRETDITPQEYAKMFAGELPKPSHIRGICGRITRGTEDSHFEKLSHTEGRRLSWIVGADAMLGFVGVPHRTMILGVGKSERWLDEKIAEGMRWKLVVLPAESCVLANWDGVFRQIQTHYAEVAERILRWRVTLQSSEIIPQIEARLMQSVVRDNTDHNDHMSVANYLMAADTAINARLFLYHSIGLNELFTGTGYNSNGDKEYLIVNRPLSEFAAYALIDLDPSIDPEPNKE